jgi:hypothetical protein
LLSSWLSQRYIQYILCKNGQMTAEQASDGWILWQDAGPPRLTCRWLSTGLVPDRSMAVRITVGVAFENPSPDGLPDDTELDYLAAVEEVLQNQLSRLGARLVLVVTTRGARDWVAYAQSSKWLASWAPDFAARYLSPRQHDISAGLDPEWSTYYRFAKRAPESPRPGSHRR